MLKKIKHAVSGGLLLLALATCGGGTAGTSSTGGDLRIRQISGSVQDTDGLPVTGAIIEVAGGAASTTTDSTGLFSMDAETGT